MDYKVWPVFLTKTAIKEGRQESGEGSHVELGRPAYVGSSAKVSQTHVCKVHLG